MNHRCDPRAVTGVVNVDVDGTLHARAVEAGLDVPAIVERALGRREAPSVTEGIVREREAYEAFVREHGSFPDMVRDHYAARPGSDGDAL